MLLLWLLTVQALLPARPALPGGGASEARVGFVDASFRVDGVVLDAWFLDLDGDARKELTTAVYVPERGERELRVRRISPDGLLAAEPYSVVRVLEDVVAYGYANVRDDPGSELLFLTRGGVYGYSLAREGYRGNIARLVEAEILYDVPDPRRLPRWRYLLEDDERATLLVPELETFSLWGPTAGDGSAYELGVRIMDSGDRRRLVDASDEEPNTEMSVTLDDPGRRLFLRPAADDAPGMLEARHRYHAPALVDVDGDGRRDLLLEKAGALHVHLSKPSGVEVEPSRAEELPDYLQREDTDLTMELHDLDADRDVDLLAILEGESDGLENVQIDVLVLLNDGRRLLPEKPDQVLRFEAAELRIDLVDVDGDRRADLVVRKFEMPSLIQTATGLEFRHTTLLYLGTKRGFERKPAIKDVRVYDADDIQDAIRQRKIVMDLSGDGVADQVAVGLFGEITIRRLEKESSFFRGEHWTLDSEPWKRFEVDGSILDLTVVDANGDGIGDVLSAGRDNVTVLLSRRGGGR